LNSGKPTQTLTGEVGNLGLGEHHDHDARPARFIGVVTALQGDNHGQRCADSSAWRAVHRIRYLRPTCGMSALATVLRAHVLLGVRHHFGLWLRC